MKKMNEPGDASLPKNTNYVINLEKFLPYRLSVLEQQVSKAIARKYSTPYKLSRMQWRVVSTLAQFDGITARDICNFTQMEKMQASRAISGLLNENLVKQSTSPNDQRAHLLSLTDKGRDLYRRIAPAVLAEEQRIFSSLSEHELKTFQALVHKLSTALGS